MRSLFLLLAVASAARLSDTNRPVAKVVKLLNDMAAQIKVEGEKDQELYDKMMCWCKTTRAEKEGAISNGEANQKKFSAAVKSHSATAVAMQGSLKKTKTELEANHNALNKASAQRDEELRIFNEEAQNSQQAINGLKNALRVLKKHQGGFVQEVMLELSHTVPMDLEILGPELLAKAKNIMNLMQQPTGAKSYDSQSGEIFGMLSQMLERFENELSEANKNDADKAANFADMSAAKRKEIESNRKQIEAHTKVEADASAAAAQNQQALEDTIRELNSDREFLADLNQDCADSDSEFAARQKTRAAEQRAIGETVQILNDDDARAGFEKTTADHNARAATSLGFLQLGNKSARTRLVSFLSAAAKRNPMSHKLALLAQQAKLDAFTKVKKAMDDMVAQLTSEQEQEVKDRDQCVKSLRQNESETNDVRRDLAANEGLIGKLTSKVEELNNEIAATNDQIAANKKAIREAGDNRARANANFQTTVNDARATQAVLNKAYMRMKMFYDPDVVMEGLNEAPAMKDGMMMFRGELFTGATPDGQQWDNGRPAGSAAGVGLDLAQRPQGFNKMEKNAGGNKILNMLKDIMQEQTDAETEAINDEKEQMNAYQQMVRVTNKNTQELLEANDDATEVLATKNAELADTKNEFANNNNMWGTLVEQSKDVHKNCDFLIKNFTMRQSARENEMNAMREAKDILSGAQ